MRMVHNERGVSGTEMALIMLLIVTVAFAAVGFFGGSVTEHVEQIPDAFDGEVEFGENPPGGGGGGPELGPIDELCEIDPEHEDCDLLTPPPSSPPST